MVLNIEGFRLKSFYDHIYEEIKMRRKKLSRNGQSLLIIKKAKAAQAFN